MQLKRFGNIYKSTRTSSSCCGKPHDISATSLEATGTKQHSGNPEIHRAPRTVEEPEVEKLLSGEVAVDSLHHNSRL